MIPLILQGLWLFRAVSLRFSLWVHKIFRHKSLTSFSRTLHKFDHWFKSFPLHWPEVPWILLNQHQKQFELLLFKSWFLQNLQSNFQKVPKQEWALRSVGMSRVVRARTFHNACFLWANEKNIIFQFYVFPLKIQTVVIRLGPADDDIGFGALLGAQNETSVQKEKRITEAMGFSRNTLFCRNLSGTFHLF